MITMRFRLFLAFLALMAMRLFGDDSSNMVRRCYSIQPAIADVVVCPAPAGPQEPSSDEIRQFFAKEGVSFPSGSTISYDPRSHELCMLNAAENHASLRGVILKYNLIPSQVQMDASFVAFELKEIEDVARKNADAAPASDQIRELWKLGKGHLLGTHKLVTRSGVNAQSQGVDEQIYPTEFETGVSTNETALPGIIAAASGSFETREVGMILNSTPTIGPDGKSIDLVIAPELSDLVAWDDIETSAQDQAGHSLKFTERQPRFHTNRLTTTVVLDDGAMLIQGGMASRDGKSLVYLFLTARIIDANGQPVHPKASEKSPVEAAAKK